MADVTMPDLEVQYVPTESLVPYARNAKLHTATQIEHLKNSIKEFGFNDPIGIYTRNGAPEIVEGHGRVLAAKELGLSEVPTISLDHMTDEERRLYTHAHNHINQETGDDLDVLAADLEELQEVVSLEALGFMAEAEAERAEAEIMYSEALGRVIYEPSDRRWDVDDLVDQPKIESINSLIAEVEDERMRQFLGLRAASLAEFNFSRIADYYCNQATEAEKKAFEALALVLLDRDKLIENGYAKLMEMVEEGAFFDVG